ncbi:hypothetical protein HNQ91_004464 [Filimonas zeae]|nr:glycosyl hydrolase [Filimonas zeae]MDR6341391.1 hypothetical protein [Filimonas zeae]
MMSARFILFLLPVICMVSCSKEAHPEADRLPEAAVTRIKKAAPLVVADGFIWGINGHPLTQEAYKNNIELQLNLVQKMGMSYYRVDVPTDTNGVVIQQAVMDELLHKSAARNISLLPMLYLTGWQKSSNEADAFRRGRKIGFSFASVYSSHFHYYEMGNEEERKILKGGHGDKTTDYDLQQFKLLAAFFKGMYEGIKAVDPAAQTIIDNSGWLHYGYFQLLRDYNVPYDILGLHWYSDMGDLDNAKGHGDILSIVSSFQKPVWITEINRRHGSWNSDGTSAEEDQRAWMDRYMLQLHQRKQVKAFFVYELLDEPAFADKSKPAYNPSESVYGVVNWVSRYTTYTFKPLFAAMQYRIEETQYGNEDFLRAVYRKLYATEAGVQWLHYWLQRLASGVTAEQVVAVLLKDAGQSATLAADLLSETFWKEAIIYGFTHR